MKDFICLIGGNGYIGSALFRYLKSAGYKVQSYDLNWFGDFSEGNIQTDYSNISIDELNEYDWAINLASHSSVPLCRDNPDCIDNNVSKFAKFLHKCDSINLPVIYSSSSSVYSGHVAAKESCPLCPSLSYYDMTMRARDEVAGLYPLNTYGLRFGTLFGGSPNLRVDTLINSMINSALTKGHIEMYNKDIRRPVLSIETCCKSIEAIISYGQQYGGGIYNLSDLSGTVGFFGKLVSETLDCPLMDKGNSGRPFDFSMDNSKFAARYGDLTSPDIEPTINSLVDNRRFMARSRRDNLVF